MKITAEFCRICLKSSSVFNEETNCFESFSIYKKDENNLSFADKLQHLTKFNIPRNVPLAKRICQGCSTKLNSSYILIKQCEENERIIQNYINEDTIKNHMKNTLFQQQFRDSIKYNKLKQQIKIEPFVSQDNSSVLASDYDNENTDDNSYFQTEKYDNCEPPEDIENRRKIEISPQIKKNKSDSEYEDDDDDNDKDQDFTVDDVVESQSDSDESDSDYAPRTRKPNLKIISSIKSKRIGVPKSKLRSRVIKLSLIRGSKLKTVSNVSEKVVHPENSGVNSTKDIENELTKTKIQIKTRLLKNRNLIKLIPNNRNKKIINLKGRKKIYLKSNQSDFGNCKATICPICGKMYQSGDTMRGHMKWHENNEECFKCDVCGKGFDNPSYLRSHKRIHSKRATPYTCEICGKAFFHPNKLRLHTQYSHTEDRLKCPHCEVTVKYPSSLKRHLFTHNDIKNYECIDCSKTFRSRSNLNQHLESKFHSTKEIQPMIRIKGIAEQYVAGPPKPSYTKKRKLPIKKENTSREEIQISGDQPIESILSSHITYEDYDNESQIAGNYLINNFDQFSNIKDE